jgi:hypothetical protein
MNEIISMFIDDEMDLEDKINLISRIRHDKSFATETADLLQQEKRIRAQVVDRPPSFEFKPAFRWKQFLAPFCRPMPIAIATTVVVLTALFLFSLSPEHVLHHNRFIIYQPNVNKVEITGSFTQWRRLPMKKLGDSGYWEIQLDLPEGEHRYTYILNGHETFADPTILAHERDDFGGQNSILNIGKKI